MSHEEASIFATRYISAIGISALFYDHALTIGDEIHLIWRNAAAGIGNRIGFIINRYISEAMTIYVAYMLSGGSHGLDDELSGLHLDICGGLNNICGCFPLVASWVTYIPVVIMSRLYTLWDHRERIKWILMSAFGIAISLSMAFSILAAHQVQPFLKYNPFIHMCVFAKKPWALPFMLGSLTVFDFFIIVMTVVNALDRPHQTQAEVMTSIQHDGARMFIYYPNLCPVPLLTILNISEQLVLRLIALIMAIVGDPSDCFVTLSIVWAMCSVVNSRLQLRVEGLRFISFMINDEVEYASLARVLHHQT
ncbi:hypothetical protein C8J57DRAFT_1573568 [Mycena rebaudengoi]|nr:hypothetical protein C8J57DRAFT_1573568 [Mycena rebaudengoi]